MEEERNCHSKDDDLPTLSYLNDDSIPIGVKASTNDDHLANNDVAISADMQNVPQEAPEIDGDLKLNGDDEGEILSEHEEGEDFMDTVPSKGNSSETHTNNNKSTKTNKSTKHTSKDEPAPSVSKKAALDNLRNMKFSKGDPFKQTSVFRLTSVGGKNDSSDRARSKRASEYHDSSDERSKRNGSYRAPSREREKYTTGETRKRSHSRTRRDQERQLESEERKDVERRHRSTMYLLRNEQNAAAQQKSFQQSRPAPHPDFEKRKLQQQLDAFLSMPEEKVFTLSESELKAFVLQGIELYRENEKDISDKKKLIFEYDHIIANEKETLERLAQELPPQYYSAFAPNDHMILPPFLQDRPPPNFGPASSMASGPSGMFPGHSQSIPFGHLPPTRPDLSVPPPNFGASAGGSTGGNVGGGFPPHQQGSGPPPLQQSQLPLTYPSMDQQQPMSMPPGAPPPVPRPPIGGQGVQPTQLLPPPASSNDTTTITFTGPPPPLPTVSMVNSTAAPTSSTTPVVASSAIQQSKLNIPPPNTAIPPPIPHQSMSTTSVPPPSVPPPPHPLSSIVQQQHQMESGMQQSQSHIQSQQQQFPPPLNLPPPPASSISSGSAQQQQLFSQPTSLITQQQQQPSGSSSSSTLPSMNVPPPSMSASINPQQGASSSIAVPPPLAPGQQFTTPPPNLPGALSGGLSSSGGGTSFQSSTLLSLSSSMPTSSLQQMAGTIITSSTSSSSSAMLLSSARRVDSSGIPSIDFSQPPPNLSKPPPSIPPPHQQQFQQQLTQTSSSTLALSSHHVQQQQQFSASSLPNLTIPPPNLQQKSQQQMDSSLFPIELIQQQQQIIAQAISGGSSTLAAALDLGGIPSHSSLQHRILPSAGGTSPFRNPFYQEASSSPRKVGGEPQPLMSLRISLSDLKSSSPQKLLSVQQQQKRNPTPSKMANRAMQRLRQTQRGPIRRSPPPRPRRHRASEHVSSSSGHESLRLRQTSSSNPLNSSSPSKLGAMKDSSLMMAVPVSPEASGDGEVSSSMLVEVSPSDGGGGAMSNTSEDVCTSTSVGRPGALKRLDEAEENQITGEMSNEAEAAVEFGENESCDGGHNDSFLSSQSGQLKIDDESFECP